MKKSFDPKNSPKLNSSQLEEQYHIQAELVIFQTELFYCSLLLVFFSVFSIFLLLYFFIGWPYCHPSAAPRAVKHPTKQGIK